MFITWCMSWQFGRAVFVGTRVPRWWCRCRNSKPEPPPAHTNWPTISSKASLMVMFQPLPPYLGQVIGLKKAHQSIYGKIEKKHFVDKRQFVHFPELPGDGDSNWGTAVPAWLSQPHQKLCYYHFLHFQVSKWTSKLESVANLTSFYYKRRVNFKLSCCELLLTIKVAIDCYIICLVKYWC